MSRQNGCLDNFDGIPKALCQNFVTCAREGVKISITKIKKICYIGGGVGLWPNYKVGFVTPKGKFWIIGNWFVKGLLCFRTLFKLFQVIFRTVLMVISTNISKFSPAAPLYHQWSLCNHYKINTVVENFEIFNSDCKGTSVCEKILKKLYIWKLKIPYYRSLAMISRS